MDNVTHSLIGYALGRVATHGRSRQEQRAGIWASIVASNAPDLDLIVSFVSDNGKLAYLAHHRGHTHTLLWAVPIGFACAELFLRMFKVSERGAGSRVYLLAALAGFLHIAFDYLNNYGVHPFFPLDNRWYYGDAVFIIEPLLFAALLPALAFGASTRAGRTAGLSLIGAVLALIWGVSLVPLSSALAGTIGLLAMSIAHRLVTRERPSAGPWLALASTLAVVLLFTGTRPAAAAVFTRALNERAPDEDVAQLVLTPMPANPLCWSALAVTIDDEDTYRARFGYASLMPALIAAESCRMLPRGPTTAPLTDSKLTSLQSETLPSAVFDLAYEGKLEELRRLAQQSCQARILLQFARAPFWMKNGAATIAGDLRYDNEPELAFAELELADTCTDRPVPWVPPLRALFD
jgi:inner membrane protein